MQNICKPASCLHHLLHVLVTVISRLRYSTRLYHPVSCTKSLIYKVCTWCRCKCEYELWSTAKQYDERLCSVYSLQCVQRALLDLLTLQPHTRWLQEGASRQTRPEEVVGVSIHAAVLVPESATPERCTVSWPQVVVSVKCAEHHTIAVAEWITTGVTWVSRHLQRVVGRLRQYYERTVLGVVPAAGVTWL